MIPVKYYIYTRVKNEIEGHLWNDMANIEDHPISNQSLEKIRTQLLNRISILILGQILNRIINGN